MSWFAVDRKNPRCDWNEQNSPLFVKIPVARVENFLELIVAWAGGMSRRGGIECPLQHKGGRLTPVTSASCAMMFFFFCFFGFSLQQ